MEIYGYIRVSSARQRVDRQMADLQSLGVPEDSIFIDKKSGKDFNRPSYQALLKKLRRGDLLYIKSIDRLGRNSDEIQEQWKFLTQEKGVDIAVIDAPCLDTRIKNDFLCEFINRILLYIMSFLAENERLITLKRQAEGIKAAKRRGVRFGRARKPLPENFTECRDLYFAHKLTVREAAELCGMAKSTFADAVKRTLQEGGDQSEIQENQSVKEEKCATKKKRTVKPALSKPKKPRKKTAQKSTGWKRNWTKFFTFMRETSNFPFSVTKVSNKAAPQSCKNTRKRKKPGRK